MAIMIKGMIQINFQLYLQKPEKIVEVQLVSAKDGLEEEGVSKIITFYVIKPVLFSAPQIPSGIW